MLFIPTILIRPSLYHYQSSVYSVNMSILKTGLLDKNYLSISENQGEWYSGTEQPHPASPPYPKSLYPVRPEEWADILKISRSHDVSLTDMSIAQGHEDVADFNNECSNCLLIGRFGNSLSDYHSQIFTVKGGCREITIGGEILSQPGSMADVVVGGWSDQSYAPSTDLDFSELTRPEANKKVTFVFGRVVNPIRAALGRPTGIKLPKKAKVLFWKSLGLQAYWYGKRIYVWAVVKWFL